ncbi:hypothetical protein QYH69_34970 [Paraburkholderia sp. SARCC-3016]|uniref:hypothetical protein n=1 Tax=Paraburkholderia sp. SARCC-3016 TaxID=3058611 RepID=UPI002809845A|nr:hypothetical protein [Paraburkholderia sp. SARCC-3016]MDQ7982422.1 hypothetical protein [Paraburkholderia sp. SARCC-3016]
MYRLKSPLDAFAVGVFHYPSGALDETMDSLRKLKSHGLPVVEYSKPITVTGAGQGMQQAVYMPYVDGAVSAKELRDDVGISDVVRINATTFADLDKIEEALLSGGNGHGLAVWDFDMLVGKDGRVRVCDPAQVHEVEPSGRGKQTQQENLMLLGRLRAALTNIS